MSHLKDCKVTLYQKSILGDVPLLLQKHCTCSQSEGEKREVKKHRVSCAADLDGCYDGCEDALVPKVAREMEALITHTPMKLKNKPRREMTLKEFIETAIKGGWYKEATYKIEGEEIIFMRVKYDAITGVLPFSTALLDHTLWQAVGRELGWSDYTEIITYYDRNRVNRDCTHSHNEETWKHSQHKFLDSLQEGKSLTDAVNDATK